MEKGHSDLTHLKQVKSHMAESWVVIKGSVECNLMDTDGSTLGKPILEKTVIVL